MQIIVKFLMATVYFVGFGSALGQKQAYHCLWNLD
jgi:hypothetical protein